MAEVTRDDYSRTSVNQLISQGLGLLLQNMISRCFARQRLMTIY